MGDKAILVKARQELENMYLGVQDNSVDLTFNYLVSFQQDGVSEKKITGMEQIHKEPAKDLKEKAALDKSPSLDFMNGLKGVIGTRHEADAEIYREKLAPKVVENNQVSDDVTSFSMASRMPCEDRGGENRRPGIPHSNICALCSAYIYIYRHRCLVCGRVYCRQCVLIGMAEMTEGRKCVECLGRRFSQRYINKAGKVGCCFSRYPSEVRQQELKWAEKGPRRSVEKKYGTSDMASRSRSPIWPGSPTGSYHNNAPAFLPMSRSRSPLRPGTPTQSFVGGNPFSFIMSKGFPRTNAFPL